MRRRATWVVLTVALLGVPVRAWSDTVIDLSMEEMAAAATAVVFARVERVEAAWDAAREHIYTEVELRVISYLAGNGPDRLHLRILGGAVGDQELYVSGQPRFTEGERVVAFLERVEDDEGEHLVVSCLAAGLYHVTTDRVTGEQVLRRDLSGLIRVPGPGRRALLRRRVARPLTLGEVIERVRSVRGAGGVR